MMKWMVVTLGLGVALWGSVYLRAFATQDRLGDLSTGVTLGPGYATD
jgi:hypothetical protein